MAINVDIAELVKDRINAGTYLYSESFEAVRAYDLEMDKTQLQTVKVTVVPREMSTQIEGRYGDEEVISVHVAIQRVVSLSQQAAIDDLMHLVEQIRLQLRRFNLATEPPAKWTGTHNVPIFDKAWLRENHIFGSLLNSQYRLTRPGN